ncbi:aldo-keto reductase AKR2E4-like isoform X1 [Bombyx mandarina]|uniref:Aldo-keto reductase AKR2E4-like isoform X1 n=2 Tax=Bombyx mandarina TaxID=7092 RepID=A0A6J2KFX2_BOMMA|nr:aldo-keto reductase AKR2E4-like isoform X1 [Bombyx mandarina]
MAVCARLLVLSLWGLGLASTMEVPSLKMNNGRDMPAIGLGTYLGFDQNGVVTSKNKQLRDVVMRAIDVGYRHFDTASVYETEQEIGEAVKMKVEEGVVKREDIFITTKLWNTQHRRTEVAQAINDSLKKLGLDYIDLYLMHWPIGLNADYSHSDVDFMETWRGLEDAQRMGIVKGIGLSNFNKQQLERVLKEGTIKPDAIQIEVHLQNVQKEMVEFCQSEGVVVMGYSPFGSLVARHGSTVEGPKMDDPVLSSIAQKYGKTTPQIVLRWQIERKVVPIPKTVNPKRLEENINIFDFTLTPDEVEKINGFDTHTRYTLPSFWQNHPYYPFDKVDNPIADPFIKV